MSYNSAASKEAGAPADPEIEVTPEMIEAGVVHLYRYHPDRGLTDEEAVKAIFSAMMGAKMNCGASCRSPS